MGHTGHSLVTALVGQFSTIIATLYNLPSSSIRSYQTSMTWLVSLTVCLLSCSAQFASCTYHMEDGSSRDYLTKLSLFSPSSLQIPVASLRLLPNMALTKSISTEAGAQPTHDTALLYWIRSTQ